MGIFIRTSASALHFDALSLSHSACVSHSASPSISFVGIEIKSNSVPFTPAPQSNLPRTPDDAHRRLCPPRSKAIVTSETPFLFFLFPPLSSFNLIPIFVSKFLFLYSSISILLPPPPPPPPPSPLLRPVLFSFDSVDSIDSIDRRRFLESLPVPINSFYQIDQFLSFD